MGRIGGWLREGLLRLLGMLSAGSRALWRIRLLIPLSWAALALLTLGFLVVAERGLEVLRIWRAPRASVRALTALSVPSSRYYQVEGLVHYDQGYVEYMAVEGQEDSRKHIVRTFYLLLDPDRQWGILVERQGEIRYAGTSPLPPVRKLVAGELVEIDTRLRGQLIRDGWGQPVGMSVALHWMLVEVPLRFPGLELFLLALDLLAVGFLLVSRWAGFTLFWPQAGALGTADPEVEPLQRMDMQVSATLPLRGTRRRVQLVEALAGLRRAGDGWQVVTYEEGISSPLSIDLPAGGIEQVRPGRVYLGRSPRWGLWVDYREGAPGRARYHLSLSFSDARVQRAVYDLLTGAASRPAAEG